VADFGLALLARECDDCCHNNSESSSCNGSAPCYSALEIVEFIIIVTIIFTIIITMFYTLGTKLASVALLVALQYVDRRVWVRGPGWPDHCVRL